MPKCNGQNEDPVGRHAKAAKAAEAKAAKAAKATEKTKKAIEAEVAKEKLAQVEANESYVQAQEQRKCIR